MANHHGLWFRVYANIREHPKLKSVHPTHRWRFIEILCLKKLGYWDGAELPAMCRYFAGKHAATLSSFKILSAAGLLDEDGEPHEWNLLQYQSDSSAERTRKWREKKAKCDVTVTPSESETETETDKEYIPQVAEVIEHLNSITGRKYNAKSKQTRKHLIARFKAGYTVGDCKQVVDNKWKEWKDDQKYRKFVRPSTLFYSPDNFEAYLNQDIKPPKKERPVLRGWGND